MRFTGRVAGAVIWLSAVIGPVGPGGGLPAALAQQEQTVASEIGELKDDLAGIKAELKAVREELKAIRTLLSQRPAQRPQPPQVSTVAMAGNPMLGRKDAPVTMIEFSDYQCPFCKRFFENTLPTIKTQYVDTGKVRYVFRDFPLDRIHPQARKAAEAAHCAGEQGKYWEMHDLLFQNQRALQVEKLKEYARSLEGLEPSAFDTCLDEGTYGAEVQKDYDDGTAAGIRGTPGFFIGRTGSGDTIRGTFIRGAQPFQAFNQEIERQLKAPAK